MRKLRTAFISATLVFLIGWTSLAIGAVAPKYPGREALVPYLAGVSEGVCSQGQRVSSAEFQLPDGNVWKMWFSETGHVVVAFFPQGAHRPSHIWTGLQGPDDLKLGLPRAFDPDLFRSGPCGALFPETA